MGNFAYTPTPHQLEDAAALVEYERGLLWADPGTGKTFTTIIAAAEIGFDRIVVVCPKIAMYMWEEELKKHLNIDAFRLRNIRKSPGFFRNKALIVSYDLLGRNERVQEAITRYAQGWDEYRSRSQAERNHRKTLLVLDEAHYIKSASAKRTTAIVGKNLSARNIHAGFSRGLERHFTDVWQLTGTPVTRHVDDLYTQLMLARPDLMRSFGVNTLAKFVDKFCTTQWKQYHPRSPKRRVVTGSKNLDMLERLLTEAGVIRRKLADVVDDLPEATYRTVSVSYKQVPKADVLGMDHAALMRELTKPDSMLAKLRRQLGLAKVADTVDYINTERRGPMLVGFWHTSVGAAYLEAFQDLRVGYIDGSTPDAARNQYIAAFNAGELDILIGQIKALGVAANLQQASSHVVVAEEVMSPAELEQFVARVVRRGQRQHVQVDLIRSDHDLDSAMAEMRLSKAAVIDYVV